MEYCRYHPDKAATHYCHHCATYSCDHCSNERNDWEARCFNCQGDLEDLGAGFSAEPFWRRLDKMFKYAFDLEVMIYISVVAVLTSILSFLPTRLITLFFLLTLTGAFIKYCFTCLEQTASGNMKPPAVVDGYQGGLSALFQLVLLFACFGVMCALAIIGLGKNLGALISVLLIAALPAAIITLAVQNSVLQAINPLKLWHIISSVGLSYGILLAFLMIMSSSIGLLSSLFANEMTFVGTIIQSFFSNFYSVVMFHLMGYMIFQYQRNLGFSARGSDNKKRIRTDAEKTKAKLSMLMREGRFDDVIPAYKKAMKDNANDLTLAKQYFDFLKSTHNADALADFGEDYLRLLQDQSREFDIPSVYKHLRHVIPSFLPESPVMRVALAQQLYELGDHRTAIPLLKDLHKQFPEFGNIPKAYLLFASILDDIDKPELATQFRQFSANWENVRQQAQKKRHQQLESSLVAKAHPTHVNQQPVAASQPAQQPVQHDTQGTLGGLSLVPRDEH